MVDLHFLAAGTSTALALSRGSRAGMCIQSHSTELVTKEMRSTPVRRGAQLSYMEHCDGGTRTWKFRGRDLAWGCRKESAETNQREGGVNGSSSPENNLCMQYNLTPIRLPTRLYIAQNGKARERSPPTHARKQLPGALKAQY